MKEILFGIAGKHVSLIAACVGLCGILLGQSSVTILNVSYDPTRELYKEFNARFAEYWMKEKGQKVEIRQSHGGAGKQARAVIDGLQADVVTLALAYDIDAIQRAGLIRKGWNSRLPNNSAPYTSTIIFLVRKGNPKKILDWDDLVKEGISVITPNPKTSGGARWNYLAAWGYALKRFKGNELNVQQFMKKLYRNVPILDAGARGSTTTFVERGIGDVFISWENEALLAMKELGAGEFEIVVPSISILAEPPVAIIDKTVDKRGTREVAQAYLEYLYSEEGQLIAAKHYYRPQMESVMKKFKNHFPSVTLFTLDDLFVSWQNAQRIHFIDGGTFDQLYQSEE